MAGLARFHVDCSDPIRPVVSVNDETVPPIKRASFDWTPGDVPHLYLEFLGAGVLEGEGIVVQQIPIPDDGLEAMRTFLAGLDPQQLEQAMLEEMVGFGSEVTTGQACLAVLAKWVSGG